MSALLSDLALLPEHETLPAVAGDGATAEVLLQLPAGDIRHVLYWLPALGVSARQYLPLARALAAQGTAVAIHEWRGIGSSNQRAARQVDWGYRELLMADVPAGFQALHARLPRERYWIGGHSLGSQMASLYASMNPRQVMGVLIVAGGAPYWRQYRFGPLLRLAYSVAPLIAQGVGYFPGRRIGFGGNEACRVIADWARTGRTGRYAAEGVAADFEQRLRELALPVLALRMQDDWLGPEASLAWLLGKMPLSQRKQELVTAADFDGRPADHFGWMKTPEPVADRMARWLSGSS